MFAGRTFRDSRSCRGTRRVARWSLDQPALPAQAAVEQCRLPAVESIAERVDVLGKRALEARSRGAAQMLKRVLALLNVAADVSSASTGEAIRLHVGKQRAIRLLGRHDTAGWCAKHFPRRHVRLGADVHELAAARQLVALNQVRLEEHADAALNLLQQALWSIR